MGIFILWGAEEQGRSWVSEMNTVGGRRGAETRLDRHKKKEETKSAGTTKTGENC